LTPTRNIIPYLIRQVVGMLMHTRSAYFGNTYFISVTVLTFNFITIAYFKSVLFNWSPVYIIFVTFTSLDCPTLWVYFTWKSMESRIAAREVLLNSMESRIAAREVLLKSVKIRTVAVRFIELYGKPHSRKGGTIEICKNPYSRSKVYWTISVKRHRTQPSGGAWVTNNILTEKPFLTKKEGFHAYEVKVNTLASPPTSKPSTSVYLRLYRGFSRLW
jgi:hypothetical protein